MKPVLPLLLSVLLAPGCLFSGSGDDDDGDSGADSHEPEGDPLLRECRGSADAEDVAQIAYDFEQSIHEMVACGGLAVTLCTAVVSGIVDALVASRSDATPEGWVYAGDGVYTSDAAGAAMSTRFYLADDYAFGKAGDLLTENLFLSTSYLMGASVEIDFDPSNPLSSTASLHFEEVGPYVELLGFGPAPQSPIPVGTHTWSQVEAQLGTLVFESEIAVDDPQNQSTVRYQVETPRMPASVLLGGGAMEYSLVRADASRADRGQDLVVDDWGIEFVNGSIGALEGTITFQVEGGPFPYLGSIDYRNSTYGDVDLECP